MRRGVLAFLLVTSACTRVVTTSTTEIRPSRYAVLDFEQQVPRDSMFNQLRRAVEAEGINVRDADRETGIITAGPVRIAASADQPALDAELSISTQAVGRNSRVRIFASAVLAAGQMGGKDARLMELAQRVERRLR